MDDTMEHSQQQHHEDGLQGDQDADMLLPSTHRLSLSDDSSIEEDGERDELAEDQLDESCSEENHPISHTSSSATTQPHGHPEMMEYHGSTTDSTSDNISDSQHSRIMHHSLILYSPSSYPSPSLHHMPNEVLLHVLSFLDVSDLLSTSRVSHLLRTLSLTPILHHYRLRRCRILLPPLLSSPLRPTLADLIARSIFLTHTSVVSRRLARSLVSIRLSRRLAARPSPEALVQRAVLPVECVPGMTGLHVSPAIVAKRRAVERERVKDGLRRWIGAKWKGEVREREERATRWDESRGIGRVWRLRRFWERMSRGEELGVR